MASNEPAADLAVDQDFEVRTILDEEFVANCAIENKISKDVVEKLRQEGFTSMEALKLIDNGNLNKQKLGIPPGQQKLVLAAMRNLFITRCLHKQQLRRQNYRMRGEFKISNPTPMELLTLCKTRLHRYPTTDKIHQQVRKPLRMRRPEVYRYQHPANK